MKTVMIMMLVAFGCGDNLPVLHRVPDPDAYVAPPDAAVDACIAVDAGADSCCALMPDTGAVRKCAAAQLAPGLCADVVCQRPDCSLVELEVCVAPQVDAGGDAP